MKHYRELFSIGVPMALTYLLGMLLQTADLYFVGPLGPEAIAGVSIGNAIFSVFMVFSMGILASLDFWVSRSFGEGDPAQANRYFFQGLALAAALSALSIAAMALISAHFGTFGMDAAVSANATDFLTDISWSLLPFLIFTVIRQYLQPLGKASFFTWILVLANVVNGIGDFYLVPIWGVKGSARATLLTRIFALLLAMVYLATMNQKLQLQLKRTRQWLKWDFQRDLLRIGIPAGMQMLLEVGFFSLTTVLAGRLGATAAAGHQLVLHLASLTFMVPLGLSAAGAVRVAYALGQSDPVRARKLGWATLFSCSGFMACGSFGLWAFSAPIFGAFSGDSAVLQLAISVLPIAVIFQISDGAQVGLAGALRGFGDTKSALWANFFGHWLIGLPVGAGLCFGLSFGVSGLWIGLCCGLSVVALILLRRWKAGVSATGCQGFQGTHSVVISGV